MNILHRLFPAGHFVISVLFLVAGAALIVLAGALLWQGIQPFAEAALLLVAWGVFIRLNRSAEELEPEAMPAAKREDRKIEKSAKGEAKS
jgi:hypothetical protein